MKVSLMVVLSILLLTGCQSLSHLERLKKQSGLRGYDPAIQRPYMGNIAGKVQIHLYSDFQCPSCKRLDDNLLLTVSQFSNVKVIRHEFPLDGNCNKLLIYQKIMGQNLHDFACQSAALALCKPNQYWSIHDRLYEHQREFGPKMFQKIAAYFKISPKEMAQCIDLKGDRIKTIRQQINNTLKQHATLNCTPYIIINDKEHLSGIQSVEALKTAIQSSGGKVHLSQKK